MNQVNSINSDHSKTFSENQIKLENNVENDNKEYKDDRENIEYKEVEKYLNIDSTLVDIQYINNNINLNNNKQNNAVKYKKIFKNCYFYINDVSDTYKEYFKICKGRCTSVVKYRNRLIEIILKRGGGIEASLSPYVTHFIVERPTKGCTWYIFRMKGMPKQYHFVTAKFVVECHLKGKRMLEKQYFPKFLKTPTLFTQLPSSNESTPIRNISQTDSKQPNISRILPYYKSTTNNNNDNRTNCSDYSLFGNYSNSNTTTNGYDEYNGNDNTNGYDGYITCITQNYSNNNNNNLILDTQSQLSPDTSIKVSTFPKISKFISKVESYRFTETWSRAIESECLLDFESMDPGIYFNGFIIYIYFEDFLLDALIDEYWDRPSAICKFNRIVSQNNHSRKLGIKNGMGVDTALDLCSNLKLAKYDYEKILQKGLETLRILKKYTHRILSPNYNEYYLQISYELCRELLEKSEGYKDNNDKEHKEKDNRYKEENDEIIEELRKQQRKVDNREDKDKNIDINNDNIFKLVSRIYNDVDGKCVIGIGKNMLIAKLASKKCRNLNIDSQESDYELSPILSTTGIDSIWTYFSEDICIVNDGFKFLINVYLSEIPGVNLLGPVLKSRGLVTCNDVRKTQTPICLQGILGYRLGKLVYNFCFGYDYRCANLPKKQLDFFINKSFKSYLIPENIDDNEILTQNNSIRDNTDLREEQENKDENKDYKDDKETQQTREELEKEEQNKKQEQENKKETKEDKTLRKLLTMILKQVCSVYSLFDKCIINYSIVYKCTVVLMVHIDFSYSKTQTSILDKQSLRYTINNLYRRIKKELGIEFSEIKRIQLELKDIVRVDQNVKFIDKFLKEKIPSPSRTLDTSSFYNGIYVTSKDSTDTPKESIICTPTRRLNGWRLDSLSSNVDPFQDPITPQNRKRSLSLSSGNRRNNIRSRTSTRSGGSREQTPNRINGQDSSVDSYLRTPSRTRTITQFKGQKSITEYLSPPRYENN